MSTQHVYPCTVGGEDWAPQNYQNHALDGRECWCRPKVEQVCPFCGDEEPDKAACGRCDGAGWVPPFSADTEWPTIVVHNDADQVLLN